MGGSERSGNMSPACTAKRVLKRSGEPYTPQKEATERRCRLKIEKQGYSHPCKEKSSKERHRSRTFQPAATDSYKQAPGNSRNPPGAPHEYRHYRNSKDYIGKREPIGEFTPAFQDMVQSQGDEHCEKTAVGTGIVKCAGGGIAGVEARRETEQLCPTEPAFPQPCCKKRNGYKLQNRYFTRLKMRFHWMPLRFLDHIIMPARPTMNSSGTSPQYHESIDANALSPAMK